MLLTSAAAFGTISPHVLIRRASTASTTARGIVLTEEESAAVFNKSEECIESECSLEDVQDLLTTLKETVNILEDRNQKITDVIANLQTKEKEPGEYMKFVRDLCGFFPQSKITPSGFSGDIPKGKNTA